MPAVTIGDMLEEALECERRLEAYYDDLRDRATGDGVCLLTYYLARHRRHAPDALESFSAAQMERIRQVRLKCDDTEFDPARCFHGKELASSVGGDELLNVAIDLVEGLIRFYRWIALQPVGDEAGTLFRCLLQIEEGHVIELKKIKAMDYF